MLDVLYYFMTKSIDKDDDADFWTEYRETNKN